MNAKETYTKNYSAIRSNKARRWAIDNGYGQQFDNQAMTSYRMATAKNPMTFRQFIDCLEAAHNGLAYATRNYWFFIVDGDELQFGKEECARFARYFSEGFHMNWKQYHQIMGAGGCYINERLFEDDEVFPLKETKHALYRWIYGNDLFSDAAKWVNHHNFTAAKVKADAIADEFYAQCEIEQSDLQAEMEMQRYGY